MAEAASSSGAPTWLRERGPMLAALGAVTALAVWGFVARYRFLSSSPYPLGVDGFYYPVQLRALLESGQLYYPTAPLSLWLMAPLAAITDPITGAKLGTALGGALLAIPVYLLGRRVSGDRAAGVLAAVLASTSASGFYLTTEFAKNCIGLTVAVAFLCVLGWALDRPSRRRWILASLALVAALLAHKMAAGLALVVAAPPLIVHARATGLVRSKPGRVAVAAGGLSLGMIALALLAPERFIGGADAEMIAGLFSADPSFSLAVLDTGRGPARTFGHEVIIAAALGAGVFALAISGRYHQRLRSQVPPRDRAFALGMAAVALFLAIPWIAVSDPDGLGFRLRLAAFVPLAVCAAALAGAATAWLAPLTRGALLVGIAAGWLYSRPMQATEEGVVRAHPAMVTAVLAMSDVVPRDHVVMVPERQVMFMVAWYTRNYARLSSGEVEPERRWRLITYYYQGPALRRALERARADAPPDVIRPRGLHPRSADGLVLVPERTWRWVLSTLAPDARRRYEAWE